MAERIQHSPEQSSDKQAELENVRHEKDAELKHERERAAHEVERTDVEHTKREALEAASKAEKETKVEAAPHEKKRDTPSQRKSKAKASYKATMKETQSQMSTPSRTFSKVIHNPVVEKVSEAAGSTVARPNAILAGSLTAFLFTLGLYMLAKRLGYPLSGFETIAAFILGWVAGLLFDYLRVMVTGKKA